MHPQVVQSQPGNCSICGMTLEPKNLDASEDHSEYKDIRLRFWVGLVFTIPILFFSMAHTISQNFSHWLQFILSLPVILWCALPLFKKGWFSFINHSLNMFSLISLGIGVAYLYSITAFFFQNLFPPAFLWQGKPPLYFETATTITVLVLLGQLLELKARSQTSQAIKALLKRAAKSAHKVVNGKEQIISIDQVEVGDTLHVRPGDKIPVDGIIIEGNTFIDESMITGEAMPVEKKVNSPVTGGTLNQMGSFFMLAEKVGAETILSRIIESVTMAQRSHAPIQSLADKISSVFVPFVVSMALLTFIIWAWIGPSPSFVYGLLNAVAVLIIACPCALGLATPMSIVVGMGKGAENGVLIKSAEAMEKLEKVKTLMIDKTGTLTEGRPIFKQLYSKNLGKEEEILRFAAAVEQNSEHPLANTVVAEATRRSLKIPKVENFQALPGAGISGNVENHEVLIAQPAFLQEKNISISSFQEKILEFQNEAQTVILVAIDRQVEGIITMSDPIKKTAVDAIQQLQQMGQKIVMLSGDNPQTSQWVSKKLGIPQVHAATTPIEKQKLIQKEKEKGIFVAMAGDGINDAPALAAADVGIAMGTGTDVAIESADVTLVKGDLTGIVRAMNLSHSMMRNIRQNLFLAFIYNFLSLPIAAGILYPFTGILLNPILAALAMSLSSLSVIGNALRLQWTRLK